MLSHSTVLTRWVIDTLKSMSPLLNRIILAWLTQCYTYHGLSDEEKSTHGVVEPRGIAYGIGLAIGLFSMQGEFLLFLDCC
jgi:ATP-binding cassette subfamily C (CFTR/MRP) protein 1